LRYHRPPLKQNVEVASDAGTASVAREARRSLVPPCLLAVAAAVSAALRFHALAVKSFWLDEGVSVAIAGIDWRNFVRILWRREANMSLYYFLLHFWLRLGSSEVFIRSLSVLFAVATIPVLYLLGRRLFDSRTALVAVALLTVNAYHIRYSQEARSYTLVVFLCVLCSVYFLKYIEDFSRRSRLAYVLTASLAVYAHFFAGLLVLAHWLSLRFLDPASIPREINKAWRWIALAISPIALFVLTTGAGPLSWVRRPGLGDLWAFALRLAGNGGPLLLLAYALACLAALSSLARSKKLSPMPSQTWRYYFLLLWLFLPPVFIVAVSIVRPLFLARYFLFCLPALLLLAAAGLARLRNSWILAAVVSLFLVLSLRGTVAYYQQDFDLAREDWRSAAHYVLDNSQPGDAAIFHVAESRMPYDYYHQLRGHLPSDPAILYPNHGSRVSFLDFVEKPDLSQPDRLLHSPRVWLVLSYAKTPSGLDATASTLVRLLASSYRNVETRSFSGVEVRLYSSDAAHH